MILGGTHCSWQDEDSNNSRVSYVNSGGAYVQVSTKKIKYSLRKKEKNNYDYLNRLNKINVYSYAYKYEINDDDDDKKKLRKYMKNKRYYTGLILEEVDEIFNNCVDKFKYFDINDDNKEEFNKLTKGYKPEIDEKEYIKEKNEKLKYNGINQTSLLCYTIMSIQDLNKKLEDENKLLKDKIKEIDDKFNKLLNKLNLTI